VFVIVENPIAIHSFQIHGVDCPLLSPNMQLSPTISGDVKALSQNPVLLRSLVVTGDPPVSGVQRPAESPWIAGPKIPAPSPLLGQSRPLSSA